ncbi:hypothetical protein KA344_08245, partial [bacterium]|nr:hypothetical protein [bacterium]
KRCSIKNLPSRHDSNELLTSIFVFQNRHIFLRKYDGFGRRQKQNSNREDFLEKIFPIYENVQ